MAALSQSSIGLQYGPDHHMINFEFGTWQYSCPKTSFNMDTSAALLMTVLPVLYGRHLSLWLSQISTLVSICEIADRLIRSVLVRVNYDSSISLVLGCCQKQSSNAELTFSSVLDEFLHPTVGGVPLFQPASQKPLSSTDGCRRSWNEDSNQVLRSNPDYLDKIKLKGFSKTVTVPPVQYGERSPTSVDEARFTGRKPQRNL